MPHPSDSKRILTSTPNPEQVIDQMNGKEKAREMGSVSAPSKQEPAAELAAAA